MSIAAFECLGVDLPRDDQFLTTVLAAPARIRRIDMHAGEVALVDIFITNEQPLTGAPCQYQKQ